FFFFFQAEDGIRDGHVTGVQTCALPIFEVHRVLRCGLFESVYRAALCIEFDAAGLKYLREVRVPAIYKGQLLGEYRIDFIVEDRSEERRVGKEWRVRMEAGC